jgi:hypothetical protein
MSQYNDNNNSASGNNYEHEKGFFMIRNASSFQFKEIFYVCLLTIIKGLCYTILCTSNNCCGNHVGWEILPILVLYYDHILTLWISKLWKNIPSVKVKFYNTFLDSTCVCTDIVGGILAFKKINLETSCSHLYCYIIFLLWLFTGGIHCILDLQVSHSMNHIFHCIVFICVMSLTFSLKTDSLSNDIVLQVNKSSETFTLVAESGTNFAYYIRTLIFLIVVISDSVCFKPLHQRDIERIYAIRYGFILMCPSRLLLYVVIATLLFVGFAVYKKDVQSQWCDKEKTDEGSEDEKNDCNDPKVKGGHSMFFANQNHADHLFIDISKKEEVTGKKQVQKTKVYTANTDCKKGGNATNITRKNGNENGINYESLDVNEAFRLAQQLQQQSH